MSNILANCFILQLNPIDAPSTPSGPTCTCTEQWDPICMSTISIYTVGIGLIWPSRKSECIFCHCLIWLYSFLWTGCNGVTYGNECEAKCARMSTRKCTAGTCEDANDNECVPKNPNQCLCMLIEIIRKWTILYAILSPHIPWANIIVIVWIGTREYHPICCDGTTFSNQCLADCTCPSQCTTGVCAEDSWWKWEMSA